MNIFIYFNKLYLANHNNQHCMIVEYYLISIGTIFKYIKFQITRSGNIYKIYKIL